MVRLRTGQAEPARIASGGAEVSCSTSSLYFGHEWRILAGNTLDILDLLQVIRLVAARCILS